MKVKSVAIVFAVGALAVVAGKARGCPPNANLTVSPVKALRHETVTLDGHFSYDVGGGYITKYEWDFDYQGGAFEPDYVETAHSCPDGAFDGITTHEYPTRGTQQVRLRVTDNDALSDYATASVDIDNVKIVRAGTTVSLHATIGDAIHPDNTSPQDVVVVSRGRYPETVDFSSEQITLKSTEPTDPAVVAATIIDGEYADAVLDFGSGDAASTVEGFTIMRGSPGIHINDCLPVIANCVIMRNEIGEESWATGGGMYITGAGTGLVVRKCVFTENRAYDGGGMYIDNCSATIESCLFVRNRAHDKGGGMAVSGSGAEPHITNCTFSRNSAQHYGKTTFGGGMWCTSFAAPVITNCIFWDNDAWDNDAPNNKEIYENDNGDPTFSYCDIDQTGYTSNNNLRSDPTFVNSGDPAGPDRIFCTWDDGLKIMAYSPCVDCADGDAWPSSDITGRQAVDTDNIEPDNGDGTPAYVDIGAYESPTVWFVDKDATETEDGLTWASGFRDLQEALDPEENTNLASGDEIWVAEGTYRPTTENNESVSFVLVEGVGVYGGFEASDGSRDIIDYETILSGNIVLPSDQYESYHVVTGADNAVLDGFTIAGGNADGSSPDYDGGGIYCNGVSPVISNCVIKDNKCDEHGGGFHAYNCTAEVINCFFYNNQSSYMGGAMANSGDCTGLTISNCLFADNAATTFGGAVVSRNTLSKFINCTFRNNSAQYGGAISNRSDSAPTFINCILWDNSASVNYDEIQNYLGKPLISFCDIEGCGGSDAWESDFGTDAGGNIDEDPKFIDPSSPRGSDSIFGNLDDGLRLKSKGPFPAGSPCIDAGNTYAMTCTTDIARYRRIIDDPAGDDEGIADAAIVDMGCYEYFGMKVSGGEGHSLVVKYDGSAWACGNNTFYQLGIGDTQQGKSSLDPVHDGNMTTGSDHLERITQPDAGWQHSLARDEDGYVWAWGANYRGQVGDGTTAMCYEAIRVVEGDQGSASDWLEDIVQVAAGRSGQYSLARDNSANRYVWAWGYNNYGQLGNGKSFYDGEDYDPITLARELTPVQVEDGDQSVQGEDYLANIVDIDAGIEHSIALDSSGNVFCWGRNNKGQLGGGDEATTNSDEPKQVVGEDGEGYLSGIVDVAVAPGLKLGTTSGEFGASYALDENGCVWAWGSGNYYKLGQGNLSDSSTPLKVKDGEMDTISDDLEGIVAVSAGNYHVLALDEDGYVWAWGDDYYGQLGQGSSGGYETTPVQVNKIDENTFLTDIVYIDAGFDHSMAIDKYGQIWVWGNNENGQLGLGLDCYQENQRYAVTECPE